LGYVANDVLNSNNKQKVVPIIFTMKLLLTPFLTALVATTLTSSVATASRARYGFSVGQRAAFGLSTSSPLLSRIPRGGSDETIEGTQEEEQILYLPGLLEASVVKASQVSRIDFSMSSALCYIILTSALTVSLLSPHFFQT
jgi:hypothetical protein